MSRSIEDATSALLDEREAGKNNRSSEAGRWPWSGGRLEGGLAPEARVRPVSLARARLAITPEVRPGDPNRLGGVCTPRLLDRAAR